MIGGGGRHCPWTVVDGRLLPCTFVIVAAVFVVVVVVVVVAIVLQ